MVGTVAVGEGTEGRLECLGESWVFFCGFWGVIPAGEGQPQMDLSLPMLCQSQNLGNRMFPGGGKSKMDT